MTQVLVWGFLLILCGGMIWAIAKIAEATGEARALRKKAEDDARGAQKAGGILADPRTPDDATKRLQDGTF
jgi:hypothetical protein